MKEKDVMNGKPNANNLHYLIAPLLVALALSTLAPVVVSANAQGGNNNPNKILGSPEFVLNILGKKEGWNPEGDFSNPDRHTIFVPENGDSTIWITQAPRKSGEPFAVLDGNGCDEDGAKLQLGDGYFAVYIVALGKPGGAGSTLDGVVPDPNTGEALLCLGALDTNQLKPHGKQPVWGDYTSLFYITEAQMVDYFLALGFNETMSADLASLTMTYFMSIGNYMDVDPDPLVTTPGIWIFDFFDFIVEVLPTILDELGEEPPTELNYGEYYWDLKNKGIKHLQVRFYHIKPRDWDYFADTAI